MSVSTSIPKPAGLRQSQHFAAVAAVIAVSALAAGAGIATRAIESGTLSARASVSTQTSGLRALTPQGRQYVLGILSLTPAQFQAAFGTSPTSVPDTVSGTAHASAATASSSVALPILPACGPGPCWRGATDTGQAASHQR